MLIQLHIGGYVESSQVEYDFTLIEVSDRQELLEQEIVDQIPLVKKIAQKLYGKLPKGATEVDCLISAGMLGLIEASRHYDPSCGNSFVTYAYTRIRGSMLDSLRDMDRGSRTLRQRGKAIEQAVDQLSKSLGREPTELEVADALDMTLAVYRSLVCDLWSLGLVSLDSDPECSEQSTDTLLNHISDPSAIEPLALLEKKENNAQLNRAIASLPEPQRRVVSLYYFREMTLQQIGADLGVMESCVSKIHAKAILMLRAAMMDGGTAILPDPKHLLLGHAAKRIAPNPLKAEHRWLSPIAALRLVRTH
jgi:RNA polymerase sigma factor for flagellar operon FliA